MLCLERITLRELHVPLPTPRVTPFGPIDHQRLLLLELEDADGFVAWSECAAPQTPQFSPETVDTARFAIENWLAPRLLNQPFATPQDVYPVLREGIRGHNLAIAALEMGMWALAAEKQGTSLAALLGGKRKKIALGTTLRYTADAESLVKEAGRALNAGFHRLRIKIEPGGADFEAIRAVRETFGPAVKIALDANGQFTMRNVARFWLLDTLDLTMIEQPLAWDDLSQHATLQEVIKTPICLDESITSLARVEDMARFNCGSMINLKPASVGGFAPALAIHDFCNEKNIPLWCGGQAYSGIGRAYNAALASLPGFKLPSDLTAQGVFATRDLVSQTWNVDKSAYLEVPYKESGLGIAVDTEYIEQLTLETRTLATTIAAVA